MAFFIPSREGSRDVLIENSRFAWRFFPPSIARTPRPSLIPLKKPPGTVRILVLGESAAMGDPEPSYGFCRQLERLLRAQNPDRKVEVINAGMTAIDSQVMLQIAGDAAKAECDFWIVYAGNNEVIGPFGAGSFFGRHETSRAAVQAILAIKATRVWQVIESLARWGSEAPEWQGMEAFLGLQIPRSDPRLKNIYEHFSANLARVVALGERSGARVLLVTLPVNLKDSPPFGSLHRPGLSAAERNACESALALGAQEEKAGKFGDAIRRYQEASQLDPQYAELAYRKAVCEMAQGQRKDAVRDFELARDLDTLRFRADSTINQIIRQTAEKKHIPLVDAETRCGLESTNGVAGADFFYDHVHLNFEGNHLVATLLLSEIQKSMNGGRSVVENPAVGAQSLAESLAFTDFDRGRIAQEMRARLRLSPFKEQSNAPARDENLRRVVVGLRTRPQDAAPTYVAALALNPEDWVLHANFAKLLEASGKVSEATAQWREVTRLLPHSAEAWLNLASLAGQAGRYTEAEKFCRDAIDKGADPSQVFNQLGLLASVQRNRAEAAKWFRKALKLRPGSNDARINLAAELAEQGYFTAATNQYHEVIRRDPDNLAAPNNLGSLLMREGQDEPALNLLQDALKKAPDYPQTHYNLARLYAKRGGHLEAVRHYEATLQEQPNFAQAQLGLGLELAAVGREEDALQRFAAAAALAPNWVDAQFNLGVSLAKAHRYTEAVEHFEAVVALQPSHSSAQKALARARELAQKAQGK